MYSGFFAFITAYVSLKHFRSGIWQFLLWAHVVLKQLVLLTASLVACSARIAVDRQTSDRHTDQVL